MNLSKLCIIAIGLLGAWFSIAHSQTSSPGAGASISSSVVVATVNSQTITQGQLDAVTSDALKGVVDPVVQLRIRTQALNTLINLALVEQAISRIDSKQNPDWEKIAQKAQQEAVDNAYINSRIGKIAEPRSEQIDQIYAGNPDYYSKNKIYHYLVLTFPLTDNVTAKDIETTLTIGTSAFDGVKELLGKRGAKFESMSSWGSAIDTNPKMLAILKTLADGQTIGQISPDKKGMAVIKLVGSYLDPISLEDARPMITAKVKEAMRNQAAQSVLAELRAKSKVDINDSALAVQVQNAQAIAEREAKPANLLEQFKVGWYFALILLVPAGFISFYRTPVPRNKFPKTANGNEAELTLKEKILDYIHPTMAYSGDNFNKSFLQIAAEDLGLLWNARVTQFALMIVMAIWFFIPLYQFFANPPVWLGLRMLISIALSGMACGLAIAVACWKVPRIHQVFKHHLAAVAMLIVAQFIISLV